ncbi:MAG: AMP-binding protein [Oculatellaceae cyanobacterium bins.114]|nr:AMP-binding protein [Oculatellaceae cyanobacterium bins.114]
MTNIATILQTQAEVRPQAIALIEARRDQHLSFAALEVASSRDAALLWRSGLRTGDAVLIFVPMSVQLYVALMAVFRLGMVAMFVDPSAGRDSLESCCALYPPKALIATDKAHLLKVRSPALRQIPIQFVIGLPIPGAIAWSHVKQSALLKDITPCKTDDPALVTFTSGSTGQPKAALRTHGFLLAQHQALAHSLSLTPDTVDLTTLPIFGLANLASGVTSLLPDADLRFPGQINPARLFTQIQRYQPVSTAASPALLERLADYCQRQQLTLSSFQRLFSGGAPVFPRLLERLQAIAPQAHVSAVYGSTEAEPIAHMAYHEVQPDDVAAMQAGKGLLVGMPVSEVHLRILGNRWGTPLGHYTAAEFDSLCLSTDKVGEIVVSGEHVLKSYLHGKGNEETKFQVDGRSWHRTGDAGYLDEKNRLWLMGRCSARIRDGLGDLYPFAVETAASYVAGVCRTAMTTFKGKRVLAIELAPSAGHAPLNRLKTTLVWAQIQEYKLYPKIPVDRRHNAKIDYPALHQLLQNTLSE